MSDYSFMGSPANIAAAILALFAQGVADFCPAMQFDNNGNLNSTPPTDSSGNAYIRVRAPAGLQTPSGLTAIGASTAIPFCGVWLGEPS